MMDQYESVAVGEEKPAMAAPAGASEEKMAAAKRSFARRGRGRTQAAQLIAYSRRNGMKKISRKKIIEKISKSAMSIETSEESVGQRRKLFNENQRHHYVGKNGSMALDVARKKKVIRGVDGDGRRIGENSVNENSISENSERHLKMSEKK